MATNIPVRVLPGVYRPTDNLGYAMPGPYPVGCIGAYTLGGSLAASKVNEIAGGIPDAEVSGTDPTVHFAGLLTIEGSALFVDYKLQAPCTIVAIVAEPEVIPGDGVTYGGVVQSLLVGSLGLILSSAGNYAAFMNNGANVSATLPASGGPRAEFLAAVFDDDTMTISLHRPRTGEVATVSVTSFPEVTLNYRVLGSTIGADGGAKGYRNLPFSRALSAFEIRALALAEGVKIAERGLDIEVT